MYSRVDTKDASANLTGAQDITAESATPVKLEEKELRPILAYSGLGYRHLTACLLFLCNVTLYLQRVNVSVAIVAMVESGGSVSVIGTECPNIENVLPKEFNDTLNATKVDDGRFDWTPEQQGLILGAFYYGYAAIQIPSGLVAARFSGRVLICGVLLMSSILTFLNPIAANQGMVALIMARLVQGFILGPLWPSAMAMVFRWSSPQDRSRNNAFVVSGNFIGSVVGLSLCGYLSQVAGWEYTFYVPGLLGLIVFIAVFFFLHHSPIEHPKISPEELSYIVENQPKCQTGKAAPFSNTPWRSILCSMPYWAFVVAQIGSTWGFYTLLSQMPTYLSVIQHLPLAMMGLMSSIPYLLHVVAAIPLGFLADWLLSTKKLTTQQTRKLFSVIGMLGPASAFIALAFVGCDTMAAVTMLCLTMAFIGAVQSGYMLNLMEIAPNHVATLTGFSHFLSQMTGILAPFINGYITDNNQTLQAWSWIFLINAAANLSCMTFYLIFASSEIQPWN